MLLSHIQLILELQEVSGPCFFHVKSLHCNRTLTKYIFMIFLKTIDSLKVLQI
jgi:hypothetical protein